LQVATKFRIVSIVEVAEQLWPLGSSPGGLLLFIRVCKNFAILPIYKPNYNAVGFTITLRLQPVVTRCTQKSILITQNY
jgi:hypothetical protein